MAKKFEVKLRDTHGGSEYRRGGFVFTAHRVSQFVPVPVTLSEHQLTDEIRSDLHLEVTEMPEEKLRR